MAVRIGILLTYPKNEVKKADLITHNASLPYTQHAEPDLVLERRYAWQGEDLKRVKRHPMGKYGVPTDVAIGCYVRHLGKASSNVSVDFILPHEITPERLKANDLNFLLIYDLLEAFHTDKTKGKQVYKQLEKCLRTATNIFPPYSYQELIYSKIKYYNYLKEHKISIAPTLTMTAEEYQKLGHDAAVAKVLAHVQGEEWQEFIAKPVYGQESKDTKIFKASNKNSLEAYLQRNLERYPGLVIQKYLVSDGDTFGCGLNCPELRMYHVGGDYRYSACCAGDIVTTPKSEGGQLRAPLDKLKKIARRVMKKLPSIVMPNGARLPRLITRVDMGYRVDGRFRPFVNEIEFVPSLYSEAVRPALVQKYIGDVASQMLRITRRYVKFSHAYVKNRAVTSRRLKLGRNATKLNQKKN